MKRAIFRIGAIAAFVLSGAALGQEVLPAPVKPASGERGDKASSADPKTVAPQIHTEIRLYLANGDKITGIVKNNRFCEKPNGKDFVAAAPEEKGSGLRLFFIHDTKSYVFFPKEKYHKYERVRGLTELQFRDLSRSMEESASKKAEAQSKAGEGKAKEDDAAAEKKAAEDEALAKKKAQEAEWTALLERFSPEAGWGEERFQKIKRNRVNGIFPNDEEIEFDKQYENWRKAFDWLEAERAKQAAAEEARRAKEAEAAAKQQSTKG